MLVFLSWSGAHSRQVAEALEEFLPHVLQAVRPWFSPRITLGARWSEELEIALDKSEAGVVCLTPDNLSEPWIHYEVGKLSRTRALVCPYLLGAGPEDLVAALRERQGITHALNRDENKKLVFDLRDRLIGSGQHAPSDRQLEAQFEVWWEKILFPRLSSIEVGSPPEPRQDILEEILALVRDLSTAHARSERQRMWAELGIFPEGGAGFGSGRPSARQQARALRSMAVHDSPLAEALRPILAGESVYEAEADSTEDMPMNPFRTKPTPKPTDP